MSTTKLQLMTAVAAFATLFYAGCGDDDENVSPSSGGSGTITGGKSGSGGANSTTGGGSTTGGKASGGTGGKASGGETGTTGGVGTGGEISTGGTVGEGGTIGTGGVIGEGGGGAGGAGPVGPEPCASTDYDATAECYANCAPNKTTTSEQFLNRCSEAGVQCTKFTATLSKLGANGALPPLP